MDRKEFIEDVTKSFEQVLGVKLWDHQVKGISMALENNRHALELPTGEGKTFIVGAVAIWHALQDKQVHVTTANTYLAQRDLDWLAPLYRHYKIAHVRQNSTYLPQIAQSETAVIIYGTITEFAQGWLNDGLRYEGKPQLDHEVMILDEADYTLLDSSTLPVIVAQPVPPATKIIQSTDRLARSWNVDEQYTWDVATKVPMLTETGEQVACEYFNVQSLYDHEGLHFLHRLHQALVAKDGFIIDRDYIVRDGVVISLDEHTGRPQMGRRFNNGLHQALEAKESLAIGIDYVTRSRVGMSAYIQGYKTLLAFGATMWDDKRTFQRDYGLTVKRLPFAYISKLQVDDDKFYVTREQKLDAIRERVSEVAQDPRHRPIIVAALDPHGALEIDKILEGIEHALLLPGDAREKEIIARAGDAGRITIITPMSARGTDLPLTKEGKEKGGYLLLVSDRSLLPRHDRQLLGRVARRGEPGSACFYLASEDLWWRGLQGRPLKIVQKFGAQEDHALHPKLTKFIDQMQRQYAGSLQEKRKRVVEMDSALNPYRSLIRRLRESYLRGDKLPLDEWITSEVDMVIDLHSDEYGEIYNLERLQAAMLKLDPFAETPPETKDADELARWYVWGTLAHYEDRRITWTSQVEQQVALRMIDSLWCKYLAYAEELSDGIWLRRFAQLNPLVEYRKELEAAWLEMRASIDRKTMYYLLRNKIEARTDDGTLVAQS